MGAAVDGFPATARARRARRRAAARVQVKGIIAAVDPVVSNRQCLAPGCTRTGIAVRYGPVVVTFCPRHEREHEERYRRALLDRRDHRGSARSA